MAGITDSRLNLKLNWCNFAFVESCFCLLEEGRVCEFLVTSGDEWYLASSFLGWGRAEQAKPPINTLDCGHFIDARFTGPWRVPFFFFFFSTFMNVYFLSNHHFILPLWGGWGMCLLSVAPHLHGKEQSIFDWGTKCSSVDGLPACHQRWVVDHYSSSQSSPRNTDGHSHLLH